MGCEYTEMTVQEKTIIYVNITRIYNIHTKITGAQSAITAP